MKVLMKNVKKLPICKFLFKKKLSDDKTFGLKSILDN